MADLCSDIEADATPPPPPLSSRTGERFYFKLSNWSSVQYPGIPAGAYPAHLKFPFCLQVRRLGLRSSMSKSSAHPANAIHRMDARQS